MITSTKIRRGTKASKKWSKGNSTKTKEIGELLTFYITSQKDGIRAQSKRK